MGSFAIRSIPAIAGFWPASSSTPWASGHVDRLVLLPRVPVFDWIVNMSHIKDLDIRYKPAATPQMDRG